jgi:hypothetical protein
LKNIIIMNHAAFSSLLSGHATYGNGGPEKEKRDVGLHEAGGQGEAAPYQHPCNTYKATLIC